MKGNPSREDLGIQEFADSLKDSDHLGANILKEIRNFDDPKLMKKHFGMKLCNLKILDKEPLTKFLIL